MMRSATVILILGLAILPSAALGQNSDIALLGNVSRVVFDFGTRKETQYRIGFQGSYAHQIAENRRGRLYVEIPVSSFPAPAGGVTIRVTPAVTEIGYPRSIFFITPGIRYHFSVRPRLAVYAAAGLGVALRQQRLSLVLPGPANPGGTRLIETERGWRTTPAGDLAGGIAFRLTRLLSLRGELRGFRTSSLPGYGSGRNYPSAHAGIGFHF